MTSLKLSWPGQYTTAPSRAFKDLALQLLDNNNVVESLSVISGGPGRQNEPFLSPEQDWSGSNRPIPEGIYEIGAIAKGKFAPGIGEIWIPLTVFLEFSVNNRSAFGFHLDDNIDTAPGSAGCVVFTSRSDLDRLLEWLNSADRPKALMVDWRTGFLASHGYESLVAAGAALTPTAENISQISAIGLKLIKSFEGCERRQRDGTLTSYQDVAGVWTIGFGHTEDVREESTINQELADNYLVQDLRSVEKNVRGLAKVPLAQYQFDALVSFDFNTGSLNVSTLLKLLNDGNYAGAANEFLRWNKAKNPRNGTLVEVAGLTRRRKAEQLLFLTGKFT